MNIIKQLRTKLFSKAKKVKKFPGSKNYWENRYISHGNSGPGSYGRLAIFKADVLNHFVLNNNVNHVLEFGCGDGNQLTLSEYPNYTGLDVSKEAIKICNEKFGSDETKNFFYLNNTSKVDFTGDLTLSLDVLFHLIEDEVFNDYMSMLFSSSSKFVIIYSSNYNAQTAPHVKSRKFTDWIETNISKEWKLIEKIENKYPFDLNNPSGTSISDFYIYQKL